MNILEARRRTLGKGVYKKTVEGNPAIAQGSLARMYPGITMQGWTEQAQYEGKNLLDNTKNNISNWVIGRGMSHSASPGTIIRYDPQTYRASVIVDGIKPNTTYSFKNLDKTKIWVDRIILADDNSLGYQNVALYNNVDTQNHNEYKFTTKDDENITCAYFQVRTLPNEDGENISITESDVLNMQVCFSEGEPIYEPYTGGQPSPNPDYPQEIVSAGKWNEETQKWEYEITIANEQTAPDKNQTVTLASDRPLTKWDRLEKRNGQWGWVYKSMEITLDGSEQWKTIGNGFYIAGGIEDTVKYDKNMLIDKLIYASSGEYPRFIVTTSGEAYTPLIFNVEDSVNGIKEWLASNPLTVWYETAEETFVPLSETEQEQMNVLHTFRPTTVLSNDCECSMSLTYKTKKSMQSAPGGVS